MTHSRSHRPNRKLMKAIKLRKGTTNCSSDWMVVANLAGTSLNRMLILNALEEVGTGQREQFEDMCSMAVNCLVMDQAAISLKLFELFFSLLHSHSA